MTTRLKASPSADTAGWRAHPAAPLVPSKASESSSHTSSSERTDERRHRSAPAAIRFSVSAARWRALERSAGVRADVFDLGSLGLVEGHHFVVLGAIGFRERFRFIGIGLDVVDLEARVVAERNELVVIVQEPAAAIAVARARQIDDDVAILGRYLAVDLGHEAFALHAV